MLKNMFFYIYEKRIKNVLDSISQHYSLTLSDKELLLFNSDIFDLGKIFNEKYSKIKHAVEIDISHIHQLEQVIDVLILRNKNILTSVNNVGNLFFFNNDVKKAIINDLRVVEINAKLNISNLERLKFSILVNNNLLKHFCYNFPYFDNKKALDKKIKESKINNLLDFSFKDKSIFIYNFNHAHDSLKLNMFLK